MQSLRDGPLQSRLCLLHRVRQQLAVSEPRRAKKWIREIVARAKRVPSMLSPSSSSRDARAPTEESSLHRYREYLLARPGLNELFLPKDGSKQCDAFAVSRKPGC
jgi:hypothetical protein